MRSLEDDSETLGHSRLLRLRAVDEVVNKLMNSVNEPMALMYIQLQKTMESYGQRHASVRNRWKNSSIRHTRTQHAYTRIYVVATRSMRLMFLHERSIDQSSSRA